MELVRGDFSQTRNHWWWRPGWGPGTRYATFHLTFELAPELATEAVRCGRSLIDVPNVDAVPPEWLHLTMRLLGVEHEEQQFRPHVSLAYFRGEVDLSLLHQAIQHRRLERSPSPARCSP